jgi:radical SAM superfamily enzyme YgiQ (UPF0313 family)
MTKTLFIQPRHTYAPPIGEGHVYSPTSLWTVGSKLIEAGADIDFADENLHPANTDGADVLGVNLLGAPYIPLVRERFRSVLKGGRKFIVGGQVVTGLTQTQFDGLFGENAIHGSHLSTVAQAVGARYGELKKDEDTSLIPAYEKISDEDMRQYLDPKREISFYLGQGCIFNCRFCPAPKNRKETYRNIEVIERDLAYLTMRALKLNIHQLNIYLSNLDVFQELKELAKFASIVSALKKKHPGFVYRLRGLSTVTSFKNAVKKSPEVVRAIKDAGFHTVGFGVDGGDEKVWRSVQKGHNSKRTVIRAMQGCKEYGLTPETIMVFGHPKEDRHTLENAVRLTEQLQKKFDAVPRPHVAKDLVPGNDYWENKIKRATRADREDRARRIQILLEHPEYFQAMDFKALASSVSHPNEVLRHMVNEYYRTITNMSGNPNELIYPIAPEFSPEINTLHWYWNFGRFDR